MIWGWRWTSLGFANNAVDSMDLPVLPNLRITGVVSRKRPNQALLPAVHHDDCLQESARLTVKRFPLLHVQRIAMHDAATVMHLAKPTAKMGLPAILYRAQAPLSHAALAFFRCICRRRLSRNCRSLRSTHAMAQGSPFWASILRTEWIMAV